MTAIIILGICLAASIAGNFFLPIFLTKEHAKEKAQLHDRLMARDYPELMQGKDFQIELDKKEKEISKKPLEEKKLSPEEYADKMAAEKY